VVWLAVDGRGERYVKQVESLVKSCYERVSRKGEREEEKVVVFS